MKRFIFVPVLLTLAACTAEVQTPEETSGEILDMSRSTANEGSTVLVESGEAPAADDLALTAADAPTIQDTAPSDGASEAAEASGRVYVLRRGETLAHFARWSETPVEEIAEASGLDLAGTYDVGTEIRVPIAEEDVARLESLREEHVTRRVQGYLASRGGSQSTEVHTVRTGETAWGIARNNQGIPLWLLESYNPSVALDALRPGDRLVVPVLNDSVAAAEEDPLD